MKAWVIILLFTLVSCAEAPLRGPASDTEFRYGEVSHEKSRVKVFPPEIIKGTFVYYFYLEVKNSSGEYIDCDPSEIVTKASKGKKIPFTLKRLLTGRYYISIEKTPELTAQQLDFFIREKKLKEQFKLHLAQADRAHSKIKIVKSRRNKKTFELQLKDKSGKSVELPNEPEIILDGEGQVESLKHIKEGIWEFSIVYPEQNQVMYLSVRAHGVYLYKLFRYQHVEK